MEEINDLIKILKEHWQYKQQLAKLAKADLVKTYRGAALGWSWAIIKPVVTIFVYWFAFEIGLRSGKDVNGYPFFLWLICGLIPWFYISDMLTIGTDAIRKYSYLVTKMKFPVSTIPTFVSISKLSVNIMLTLIMLVIFILFGFKPDIYWLQLIFYTFLSFILWTMWSLFSSLLAAISKDFGNLVKSFVTAVFVTYIVNGYRQSLIDKIWFWEQPKRIGYFLISCAVMLILALWAYRKVRKDIPDVL